jgi:hypothetical protein
MGLRTVHSLPAAVGPAPAATQATASVAWALAEAAAAVGNRRHRQSRPRAKLKSRASTRPWRGCEDRTFVFLALSVLGRRQLWRANMSDATRSTGRAGVHWSNQLQPSVDGWGVPSWPAMMTGIGQW